VATIVHKPADALTIVSLMLRAGVPRAGAHLVNLAFALMIPMGVALFFAGAGRLGPEASASLTAATMAFSAGTFLCIALSDLLPELQFHAHDRLSLSVALLAGSASWPPPRPGSRAIRTSSPPRCTTCMDSPENPVRPARRAPGSSRSIGGDASSSVVP
jgi:zinc and cadmium transporter